VIKEINGQKKELGLLRKQDFSLLTLFLYLTLKGRRKEIVFLLKPFEAQRLVTVRMALGPHHSSSG
jgi:hypothetical protein